MNEDEPAPDIDCEKEVIPQIIKATQLRPDKESFKTEFQAR